MAFTKKQKLFGILFPVVLIVSYFSFFDDYFKYLEVKKNGTSDACKSYYSEFPNGYFTEDVKVIEIKDLRNIVLVREFVNDYPNSEYSSVIELINIEIWNDEIRRYDSIVHSNDRYDQEAVNFFRELLTYMRDNNQSEIYVKLNGNVNVRDFDNYAYDIRKIIDLMWEDDGRKVSENIVNITSNYRSGDINDYEQIISESILNSFENLLSDNFISISTYNNYNSSPDDLVIDINYNIENQQVVHDNKYYPNIWEYRVEKIFNSYIIGVSIKFNFLFKLPNSEYSFSLQTNPLDNISGIINISDGYRQMTKANFQKFSDVILKRFGISEK